MNGLRGRGASSGRSESTKNQYLLYVRHPASSIEIVRFAAW